MDKKKKTEHIPRPKEDLKIEKDAPKFNSVLSAIVKKPTKPKSNDDTGNK
jgi:hypothetical protein